MTSAPPLDGRMTFVEHLAELRTRLIRCVVAVLVGAVICWMLYPQIFGALIDPYCRTLGSGSAEAAGTIFGDECRLLQSDPLEGFSIRMMIAGYGGLVLAVPVILWQAWAFIAPGLYRHEKRYALPFVSIGAFLFLLGGALAYWSVPRALTFLADIGGADLVQIYSPRPYLSFITKMIVAFGVGFQFPIVLSFLQMVGIVTPEALRRQWRYALVGIVILVAILTPSGDPFTLVVLSVPMYLFYEISILIGRLAVRRRRRVDEGD
jgi:sec-independent protein translocase protein TatC